jgi:hypothetical protein
MKPNAESSEIPIAGYRVESQEGIADVKLRLRRGNLDAEISFDPVSAAVVRPGGTEPYGSFDWLHAVVTRAEASTRALTVRFDNANVLQVGGSPDFEAWQVVTPEGIWVGSPE